MLQVAVQLNNVSNMKFQIHCLKCDTCQNHIMEETITKGSGYGYASYDAIQI